MIFHTWTSQGQTVSTFVLYLAVGLARFIEISVNQSIYNRKAIIDMKIQTSVTFNGCSVRIFNQNLSVIASCDVLFRPEVPCCKHWVGINC